MAPITDTTLTINTEELEEGVASTSDGQPRHKWQLYILLIG